MAEYLPDLNPVAADFQAAADPPNASETKRVQEAFKDRGADVALLTAEAAAAYGLQEALVLKPGYSASSKYAHGFNPRSLDALDVDNVRTKSGISEGVAPKRFPDSNFDVEVLDSGQDLIAHNVNYRGTANKGLMQTTFTKSKGDLYIDATRSQVPRQGLGEEMLRKAIASAESGGAKVNTVSGELLDVNKRVLLSEGLEATPAYKIRVRNGCAEVIVTPTKENNYLLIMRK